MTEFEIGRLLVTVATAIIALAAWFTSDEALHRTYRPVLRPVPLLVEATGKLLFESALIVKNIGTGAAIAVMVFEDRHETNPAVIAETDFIEPLGPRPPAGEKARAGRFQLELDRGPWLQDGHTYRVLYQDISGRWHETRLTVKKRDFEVLYLGRKRWWQTSRPIPKAALERAQVVRAYELI